MSPSNLPPRVPISPVKRVIGAAIEDEAALAQKAAAEAVRVKVAAHAQIEALQADVGAVRPWLLKYGLPAALFVLGFILAKLF